MFLRWRCRNLSGLCDLVALGLLATATFLALFFLDFTEAFFAFTREHEDWQLDEIVITSLFVLALYLPIFSLRRWVESTRHLRQATTDSLTELYNRRRGWEILEFESVRASRHNLPLSIVLFDVDHFKEINDTHGHLAGDRILSGLATIVLEQSRKIDKVVRWGGEEFLIICVETDREGACRLADRLRQAVASTTIHDGIQVTASFGIAQCAHGESLEALIKRADDKLYEAKGSGRNTIVC